MTVPDPDPRAAVDPEAPGGVIDGGPAELPGVQDLGPADAEAETEENEADRGDRPGEDPA